MKTSETRSECHSTAWHRGQRSASLSQQMSPCTVFISSLWPYHFPPPKTAHCISKTCFSELGFLTGTLPSWDLILQKLSALFLVHLSFASLNYRTPCRKKRREKILTFPPDINSIPVWKVNLILGLQPSELRDGCSCHLNYQFVLDSDSHSTYQKIPPGCTGPVHSKLALSTQGTMISCVT